MQYLTCEVNGERVRYLRMGRGKQLLFLHGIGGMPHYYAELIKLLSKRYEVIAPAIFGLTYLDNPPRSIAAAAELISDFCRALRISPAVIVGHSYGGMVALSLPAKLTRSAKIIAMDPGPEQLRSIPFILFTATRKSLPLAVGLRGGSCLRCAWPSGARVASTLLFHPFFSYSVLKDVANFQYKSCDNAILLMGEHDEFYNKERLSRLRELCLPLQIVKGQHHDWPVYNPALAEKEILRNVARN
jgi:pimeloyl-ACP methyl ester carboxylesterase